MALVVSSHSATKSAGPTISLEQALASFQNVLTDEQKQQYQANTARPDASSVIAFVAEVDSNNDNMATRCVGPRLWTFLNATQQFTGAVDTFVNSNPVIASLVWGGVKTTILAVKNIASYFEKVTGMIMMIGKSCPLYQQFGQLYPGCISLQRALCDYFATVVRLCIKIIEVSRRHALTQTWSSIFTPFESEFKDVMDAAEQAAKHVQLQISLASKQAEQETRKLLEHENKENTSYRRLAVKFYDDNRKEHAEANQWRIRKKGREATQLRAKIKDNLATIDHVKPWKQAMRQRVPGTAEWLLQEPEFLKWKEDEGSSILWCSGTMGSGKTVLVSNIIAQLHQIRRSEDLIAYCICHSDDDASLSARNILGSLVRQLLEIQIDHIDNGALQDMFAKSRNLSSSEVIDFWLRLLDVHKVYYLILDGLDECNSTEIQTFASCIIKIWDKHTAILKIFCMGRPELEKQLFNLRIPNYRISLTPKKVEKDMDLYIAIELTKRLDDGRLKLTDPRNIVRLSQTLREKSDGMFLWTLLSIDELCEENTDNDILEASNRLPRGLAKIYDSRLRRITDRSTAMQMLSVCGVAKRPLTLAEYREVLSVSPGQKCFDRGKIPNHMDRVVGDCRGLMMVDEEDNTVHYIHQSVKQYLFVTNCSSGTNLDLTVADKHLGLLCMTYLDFSDFRQQLVKATEGGNISVQPVQLGILPVAYSTTSSRIAQKLLQHRHKLQHLSARDFERKTQEVLGVDESSRLGTELQKRQFEFRNYASKFWIHHLKKLDLEDENETWILFQRCVEGRIFLAQKPWELEQKVVDDTQTVTKMMRWLTAYSHTALLLYLYQFKPHLIGYTEKLEVLRKFAAFDHPKIPEIFIQLCQNDWKLLNYGLTQAATVGHLKGAMGFLQAGADPDGIEDLLSPLRTAAKEGHSAIVKILLIAGAKVNRPDGYFSKELQGAAERGHLEVVEMLLAAGALVNGKADDPNGYSALTAAASGGHVKVVETILKAHQNRGSSPLQAAAANNHLEVVVTLLAAGADINERDSTYFTALQRAIEQGNIEATEILLSLGADINAAPAPRYGRTALQAAAGKGQIQTVERLLDMGADVNAPASDNGGRTALQTAAEQGHLEIVERLLAAGADVNAAPSQWTEPLQVDHPGPTALQAARKGGHVKVVEILIAAGAHVIEPVPNAGGWTALIQAERGLAQRGTPRSLSNAVGERNYDIMWNGPF